MIFCDAVAIKRVSNNKAIVQRKFIHIKHNKFTNKFDNNYIYMYNKVTEVLYECIKNCRFIGFNYSYQ